MFCEDGGVGGDGGGDEVEHCFVLAGINEGLVVIDPGSTPRILLNVS